MTGLFFDQPLVARKDARIYAPPPVPVTGWRTPQPHEFPNLSAAKTISFDTETKDLNLDERGPGWGRNDSHIVGISIAAEAHNGDRGAWYFPMRHEFDPENNLDPNLVLRFADYALNSPCDKVGANLTYDVGSLRAEGVRVGGRLRDVQFAEALLDTDARVSLDVLAHKYLTTGKITAVMYDWIRRAYPNTPETKLRRNIYRTPTSLVGPYAIGDAFQPLEIFKIQEGLLAREGLLPTFWLECDLIQMMVSMRMRGVRVDLEYAGQLRERLVRETKTLYEEVLEKFGYLLLSSDSGQVGKFLEHVGVKVPRTEAGAYQVRKEWLAALEHPAGELVNNIREHEKIIGTFLDGYIFGANVNGRLHPQFHQLKGDENGTMVGRFSSSDPNLQNIPSRTKLGKLVRGCFVPDIGHYGWRKFDYSQIHYRLLAHYAVDNGDGSADELRASYINDRKMDYHMAVYKRVAPFMGWSQDYTLDEKGEFNDEIKMKRRPIKNVNFGLLYGQSAKSLAYKAGFTQQQADEFFRGYHAGAAYVKPTMEAIGKEVQRDGYVTTIGGRRIRFNYWEPVNKDWDSDELPKRYNDAIRAWGSNIKRAYEYRGVNYKFQGSEPDLMKRGMLACWESGVFNEIGVPLITVHDELDFSVIDDGARSREAYDFVQQTMQETTKLSIPVFVDESNGPSWGKAD